MQPSGSAAVDDVTADYPLDEPVTILVYSNSALDRNIQRALARDGNLQDVRPSLHAGASSMFSSRVRTGSHVYSKVCSRASMLAVETGHDLHGFRDFATHRLDFGRICICNSLFTQMNAESRHIRSQLAYRDALSKQRMSVGVTCVPCCVQVIETHVIIGEIDVATVTDGDTADTVSGETIIFSRIDGGWVSASVVGGFDSAVLGERQESCAGPTYIIDVMLRPKAIAPALPPGSAPAPAQSGAPAPEMPAPGPPEAPAPLPAEVPVEVPVEAPITPPATPPPATPAPAPLLTNTTRPLAAAAPPAPAPASTPTPAAPPPPAAAPQPRVAAPPAPGQPAVVPVVPQAAPMPVQSATTPLEGPAPVLRDVPSSTTRPAPAGAAIPEAPPGNVAAPRNAAPRTPPYLCSPG